MGGVHYPPKGAPVPCIDDISVEDVWRAVERSIGIMHRDEEPLVHIEERSFELSTRN